jgi:FkbM family methyltransferase
MICYTRNFEDVILQRVFSDVAQGCYLDAGASIPINDSNTYALYQKGWRGVAIEPLPYYQGQWKLNRPEDVWLNAAVGAETGQLTLQIYGKARQISSGSIENITHLQQNGIYPDHNIQIPMLTLNQVIAEHVPDRPLHLISIDVEGMEYEVLKGLDLQTHRPWIIVLEATFPGTAIPSHQAWEPYLLEAGYLMAYFDGVNRFYLAQEQGHLLERFSLPPNVWDDFQMAKQLELEAQVTKLKAQLTNLAQMADLAQIALDKLNS